MAGHTRSLVCALASGGLDSALLLRRMLRKGVKVLPVYVRCRLRWEKAELYWLRRFLRASSSNRLLPLKLVEAPGASSDIRHWSISGRGVPDSRSADSAVYIPKRNTLLVSAAAFVCAREGIRTIAIGVLGTSPFKDAKPAFLNRLSASLSKSLERPIRVIAPLRRISKSQLIREGKEGRIDLTYSCINPTGRLHCGYCNKCAERKRSFRAAGIADPTRYFAQREKAPVF